MNILLVDRPLRQRFQNSRNALRAVLLCSLLFSCTVAAAEKYRVGISLTGNADKDLVKLIKSCLKEKLRSQYDIKFNYPYTHVIDSVLIQPTRKDGTPGDLVTFSTSVKGVSHVSRIMMSYGWFFSENMSGIRKICIDAVSSFAHVLKPLTFTED